MKLNKRKQSTKEYVDELQKKYSKLNVVRIDFGYKKPYSDTISLDEVNKDLKTMHNAKRSNPNIYKDEVGYIVKREYTKDKGVHIHAVHIFDGQKVQQDINKAEKLGKHWEKITNKKGSYHNCNRNKYEKKGIGMLNHKDKEKREILDKEVISYLCKDEQNIETVKTNSKSRAFTRGTMPKPKSNKGRPRQKE